MKINKTLWDVYYPVLAEGVGKPIIVSTAGELSHEIEIFYRGIKTTWKPFKIVWGGDYMEIPNLIKRVINDLDPYGEENWEA